MATLNLVQFSGEIPRMIPRLLPESAAQRAENVRLDNGALTPVRAARLAQNVTGLDAGTIQTIYKHGDTWLAWDKVVHAAPGPVAQDRLYYTGDGAPKMRVDGAVYPLAVPYPSAAPVLTIGGSGSGNVTTSGYVYTFVTDFGEESEPSAISNLADWQAGQTRTLSGIQAAPAGRNITKQRFYRSQSGQTSGSDLFFIAERAASAADFIDGIALPDLGEVLPSREWNAPPDGLRGLISLPNGMMAGFVGKDLYFCEPYRPHAWPESYVLTMDYPIVALGAYGTTIVVATSGNPYLVAGSAPENMQQEKLELNLPCINARGLVDLGYAVAYPSNDGLVVASGGGAKVATDVLMTRNDWLKTSPASFVAGQFNGRYFASYEYLEADGTPSRGTFIIDLSGSMPFILRASRYAQACFYDLPSGALYMLDGVGIYEFDAFGQVNEIMTWHSKQFILPAPSSYGCIKIDANDKLTPEQIVAREAEREAAAARNAITFAQPSIGGEINGAAFNVHPVNGDQLERLQEAQFTSVNVYADSVLVANVTEVNRVVRLPAVQKAHAWEVTVNGTAEIAQIALAGTPRELNGF
ncbi:MAG TPA: hypothetical protein VL051_09495 [Burkholderiaceae bacterium]|nr:hypothetical protein [Burkholderiaceae bacterium]